MLMTPTAYNMLMSALGAVPPDGLIVLVAAHLVAAEPTPTADGHYKPPALDEGLSKAVLLLFSHLST